MTVQIFIIWVLGSLGAFFLQEPKIYIGNVIATAIVGAVEYLKEREG